MTKTKLYFKTVCHSFILCYRSSGLLIIPYFLMNLLQATFPMFTTFMLKSLIDELTSETPDMKQVALYIIIYILSLVFLQVTRSVISIFKDSLIKKAAFEFDYRVNKKLSELPLSYIDTSKGRTDIDYVKKSEMTAVNALYRLVNVFTSIYTFITSFVVLTTYGVLPALIYFALTIPGILINIKFEKKFDEFKRNSAPDKRRFSYYRWMLTDALPAKDVRMYNLSSDITKRYDEEKSNYRIANKKLDLRKFGQSTLIELIGVAGSIIYTAFIIVRFLKGELTLGGVTLCISFSLRAASAFSTALSLLLSGYTISTQRMEKVFDFFAIKHAEQSVSNGSGKRTLDHFESLEFKDVYFKYPSSDIYVLSGVSFKLNKGDKLSIVGINGSGKSTLIKLMIGLYEINSGEILINNYPMHEYEMLDVRRLFSVLFQSFVQFPLTLRENIALSETNRINDDAAIINALKKGGIWSDLDRKIENGLESNMTRQFDDKGIELSKGQWQKISLSRVYFKNAPIVILDEPSASLDAQAEDRIFRDFEKLREQKTAIMVSHRISSARLSTKIIVLDGGKITEEGTHDELLAKKGLYAELYDLQREKYMLKED